MSDEFNSKINLICRTRIMGLCYYWSGERSRALLFKLLATYFFHAKTCFSGRILVEMKAFSWLKPVLPAHIYHPYHTQMSQKSHVYQLPLLMKNEAKHEDCVDILDEYENILGEIFEQSFGKFISCSVVLFITLSVFYCNVNDG